MKNACETAITRTGWGLCNYFLVGICGLCSLAEASASLIVLVVAPLLACDLKFTKDQVVIVNAIFSLGMAIGGLLVGTLADHNGRKCLIPSTMIVVFCSTIFLAFAQKFLPIACATFLLGTGVAGNNIVLRVYLIECLPAKRRGTCLVMLDILWVLGYLSAFGIAWSLVPSVMRMWSNGFRSSSWRVLAGLGGAPSLIVACLAGLLPASPRYLLYKRNTDHALIVLQKIYAINNSVHADQYPPCALEECVRPDDVDDSGPGSVIKSLRKYATKTAKRVGIIFRRPYTIITLLSIVSRTLLFPGLIWLAMWQAYISHSENASMRNEAIRFSNDHCILNAGNIAESFLRNCQEPNNSRFQHSLLLSMSYIVGQVCLFLGIDTVGRRLSLVSSGMIGGTSILAFAFATRHSGKILLSIFYLASYGVVYTTTSIIVLENYPTAVRGTVAGLTWSIPHLVAFCAKYIASVVCTRSVYIASGLIIGATLAALPIPDLTKAPIKE